MLVDINNMELLLLLYSYMLYNRTHKLLTSNVVNTIFSIEPKYRSQSTCVCCRNAKIFVADIERTISGTC